MKIKLDPGYEAHPPLYNKCSVNKSCLLLFSSSSSPSFATGKGKKERKGKGAGLGITVLKTSFIRI